MSRYNWIFDIYDFPGLVRAIAHFNNMSVDHIEFTYNTEPFEYASVDNHWTITGSIGNLSERNSFELLQTAAHEIGHVMCDHFTPSIFRRLQRKLSKKISMDILEEAEADDFASQYAMEGKAFNGRDRI